MEIDPLCDYHPKLCFGITLGLLLLGCQIALGGWVSANYAGIACVGFPRCNGQWLPSLDLAQAFNFFSSVGQNYQGGVLENSTRVTIHMMHRLGALVTLLYLLLLALLLLKKIMDSRIRMLGIMLIVVVLMQFTLGILNVLFSLPLTVAVLHNGFAALLMSLVLMLCCMTYPKA